MRKTFFVSLKLPFMAVVSITIAIVAAFTGLCYALSCAIYPHLDAIAWPVVGKVIVVDAGHGGFDPGAVGNTGTLEKDINLAISMRLATILKQAGAVVVETRTEDMALGASKKEDLAARVELAKRANCDLFITVQANSIPQKQYRGAQTFYSKGSEAGQVIAKNIQKELNAFLKNTTRQALPISNIYVVKNLKAPVIVTEVGFLSNPEEEALLKNKAYQNKIAWSIYSGIVDYYRNCNEGKAGNEAKLGDAEKPDH